MDEADRQSLNIGDEVIITILDRISKEKIESRGNRPVYKGFTGK